MRQQRIRLLVGFGVIFGALCLSTAASAQPGDGHGGVSNAYSETAKAYRQAAAQSPARASCYIRWAIYYETLANYQDPGEPPPDPGCTGGGSGSVGSGSGNVGGGTGSVGRGSGNAGGTGGSWVEAGLDAAAQIFRNLDAQQQREKAEKQERQRQQQSSDGAGAETGAGAGAGSSCGSLTGNPIADMFVKDLHQRSGLCQSPNGGAIWLNYGVPGTTYSPGGRASDPLSEIIDLSEPDGIDRSNEPCVIDFPSGDVRYCNDQIEPQIDFPGNRPGSGTEDDQLDSLEELLDEIAGRDVIWN